MAYQCLPSELKLLKKACSSCPGFCCYRFTLPIEVRDGKPDFDAAEARYKNSRKTLLDLRKLRQLLVVVDAEPLLEGFGRHTFTCRGFDKEHGRCGIYARRPWLCRVFSCPDGRRGKVPWNTFEFGVQRKKMVAEGLIPQWMENLAQDKRKRHTSVKSSGEPKCISASVCADTIGPCTERQEIVTSAPVGSETATADISANGPIRSFPGHQHQNQVGCLPV